MHLLITQKGPPYPPAAIGPLNNPYGPSILLTPTVIRDFAQNPVRQFYTHGILLEIEPNLDPELKFLLMRCLADLPADRPSLDELQLYIRQKEALLTWNNAHDAESAWFDRIFRDAPNVSPANFSSRAVGLCL